MLGMPDWAPTVEICRQNTANTGKTKRRRCKIIRLSGDKLKLAHSVIIPVLYNHFTPNAQSLIRFMPQNPSDKDDKNQLTHFDAAGKAHMVDVGEKKETHRIAIATGSIHMKPETMTILLEGSADKGDVLGIARIAAIMGAKKTSELVPLCHPIGLTRVTVDFTAEKACIVCRAQTETIGKTGVEMEALTAVQTGLLTIYDMLKAVDRGMVMTDIRLLEKSGGQSGHWTPEKK